MLNVFFVNGHSSKDFSATDAHTTHDRKKRTSEGFEVISDDEFPHSNGDTQKPRNQNQEGDERKSEEHKDFVEISDPALSNRDERDKAVNVESSQTLLEYLFSFLETKEPLNPVLSGYFNKLVVSLLKRNHKKVYSFFSRA